MSQIVFSFYEQEEDLAFLEKQTGKKCVAGLYEEGSYALAGPLVAAACHLPPSDFLPKLKDVKTLSTSQIDILYRQMIAHPKMLYAVEVLENPSLEGVLKERERLLHSVAYRLSTPADFFLVDGTTTSLTPARTVLQGPSRSYTIAAAFVLARGVRDAIMEGHHTSWPAYRFSQNKGYPTPDHLRILKRLGPSPIHRS